MSQEVDARSVLIQTPLTYGDALELAKSVASTGCGCVLCRESYDRIAAVLMRVDVASREQALASRTHDAATCQTCIAIMARRGDDDYVNAPSDDWQVPK